MLRFVWSILLMLCLAPLLRAQSVVPQWNGLHRIDIDAWNPIDSTKKSTAEITVLPDPATTLEKVNSPCGIELHGNSNLGAAKKSYDIEMRSEHGQEEKVALLGMAPGDDYVLLSCYYDRSFLRNVFTFELWRSLGRYAPDYRFCELYLNGQYEGLYLLTERIKVDPGRVHLGDPPNGVSPGTWSSPPFLLRFDWKDPKFMPLGESLSGEYLYYRLEYPKPGNAGTYRYQTFLNEVERRFHRAVDYGEMYYEALVDLPSFADFFVVNELAKNPDGLKTSAYFYREYASVLHPEPPLKAGPVWDFDLAFDNVNYARHNETTGWAIGQFGAMSNARMLPVWWHVLCCNPKFRAFCHERASFLQGQMGTGQMEEYLRMLTFYLSPAIARDAEKWEPTRADFANDFGPLPRSGKEDLERVLSFARQRMEWIAGEMKTGNCFSPLAAERATKTTLEVQAKKGSLRIAIWADTIHPDIPLNLRCSVIDEHGQRAMEDWQWKTSGDSLEIETTHWAPGAYFLEILPEQDWMINPLTVTQPVMSSGPRVVQTSALVWIPEPVLVQQPAVSWVVPNPVGSQYTSAPSAYQSPYRFIRLHRYVKIVVE